MTKESGTTTATPAAGRQGVTAPSATVPGVPAPAPGAAVLALLALGWLAAMLWSAKVAISSSGLTSIAITSTAYSLPGVISASLVGGAAVSLALANLLSRFGVWRSTPRFAAAVAAGLLTGLLAALAVSLSYGEGRAIMVLAGATAAAATLGGVAGGLRAPLVVAAVVTAGLGVFAVTFALSYFQDPLLSLYGAGDDPSRSYNALQWFRRTSSAASGLVAGLLAFGYLRIAGRRVAGRAAGDRPLRWPAYLVAGGGPGLLMLTAELLTRTAGAEVLRMASAVSEIDQGGQHLLGNERFTAVLTVFFLGALTALVLFGRTLGPAEKPAAADPSGPADTDDPTAAGRPNTTPAEQVPGGRAGADPEVAVGPAERPTADGPEPSTTEEPGHTGDHGPAARENDGPTAPGGEAASDTGRSPAGSPEPVAGAGR
jgi:hypothetical protein